MNHLVIDITVEALAEITEAGEGVRTYQGDEAAETFAIRVAEAFRDEATRLSEEIEKNASGKPFQPVDEAASQKWAQPIYRLRVETVTRRKRSSSVGLWYAYYALRDMFGTGKPDTLRIHGLRHSASRPIESNIDDGDDNR